VIAALSDELVRDYYVVHRTAIRRGDSHINNWWHGICADLHSMYGVVRHTYYVLLIYGTLQCTNKSRISFVVASFWSANQVSFQKHQTTNKNEEHVIARNCSRRLFRHPSSRISPSSNRDNGFMVLKIDHDRERG
jgi:hypothetical protein